MTTANRLTITTSSAARTRALGRRLAKLLRPGDIVLLQGDLGAGKTTLAQGVGAGLKVEERVTSPTFVLLARHAGPVPLYHADLYRLTEPQEVEELALGEQAADGVLLVEWPERAAETLPAEHLLVAIEDVDGADQRRVTVVANGSRYRRVLDGLNARG
ncbi:MAG: tRNA (adenosine(37)-N6)-threonylcarbamoyltransferase complex ATPase subunit type 1 TsaE [Dehalococcoidia bacterium]|jgi:tRNA threonylcarbamoyladenosine biosynthesis protein TsaE|nr:tRNA (adenosine(37)-N6)-threonylcarbamoyltransferase complex ATPase subunit type 1 TsaE [Dehalococcoidia bacterium]